MRTVIGLLLVLILWSSCKKSNSGESLAGDYSGTFVRTLGSNNPVSHVTLHFTDNSFTGDSDSSHYPAICSGLYTTGKDIVYFQQECAFPANFDWTLILKDQYRLVRTADSLYLYHTTGDFAYEELIYSLKKL